MLTKAQISIIAGKLTTYPSINSFLRSSKVRQDHELERSVYGNLHGDSEYTIWNIILHDNEPCWSKFLQHFNTLLDKHSSSYHKNSVIQKTLSDVFGFVSELEFLHGLNVLDKELTIEPKVTHWSLKNTDFAIKIARRVLVEVITPRMPKKEAGFAPCDFWISSKFIDELERHFGKTITGRISEPLLIGVDGAYRGLNAENAATAFDSKNEKMKNISGVFLFRRADPVFAGSVAFVANKNCHKELLFTNEENEYFGALADNFWRRY